MKRTIFINLILLLCILCPLNAQTLNVYYKSEKAYADAKVYGLKLQAKEGKYGFVNDKGKFIIKPVFDEATEFFNELSIVKYNGCWGLIDLRGNILINPEYTSKPQTVSYKPVNDLYVKQAVIFGKSQERSEVCALIFNDGEHDIINIDKYIHEDTYDFFIAQTQTNDYQINRGFLYGKTFAVDHEGCLYDLDVLSDITKSGIRAFKMQDEWGLMDVKSGNIVVIPKERQAYKIEEYGINFVNEAEERYSYIYYDRTADEFLVIEGGQL